MPDRVGQLLDKLCVDLGFCLPPEDRQRLMDEPPSTVDSFTDAVFVAEGMDSRFYPDLRKQVRKSVARHFEKMRRR